MSTDLHALARLCLLERGFAPDFDEAVLSEVRELTPPTPDADPKIPDHRSRLWFSVDNDDSRDLDQISHAEEMSDGRAVLRVAIAEVDVLAGKGSGVDAHARQNTTSIYTAGGTFTMLPPRLCFDVTSLNEGQDRLAIVIEMELAPDGEVPRSTVYRAWVRNQAKLAYPSVGAWLEGHADPPPRVGSDGELQRQIRLQDRLAQALKALRHERGALQLMTIEARPVFDGATIVDMTAEEPNRARELIENLMVTANGATARFLEAKGFPSLRRIVRTPKRWDRIVEVAAEYGDALPPEADARALAAFLVKRREADPLRFPDLSLVVVKLIGAGEYALDPAGPEPPSGRFGLAGHFGLAVKDYTHSTAPNRRFPDLVTQRLLKAAIAGAPLPYSEDELDALARHCTEREDAAAKVERRMRKSAAALLLQKRVGDTFEGIVSGASEKGTWVRLLHPPIEGRLVRGARGLDVGHRVRVKLVRTDVEKGFIDFAKK